MVSKGIQLCLRLYLFAMLQLQQQVNELLPDGNGGKVTSALQVTYYFMFQ